MPTPRTDILCPSVPPDSPGARAFGVVTGSLASPEIEPLLPPQPVTDALLALAAPVDPTEVFRFAGTCAQDGCHHWDPDRDHALGGRCSLAQKTVAWAPVAVSRLKPCGIRGACRWFAQEGQAACVRCPQLPSLDLSRDATLRRAAHPGIRLESASPDAVPR